MARRAGVSVTPGRRQLTAMPRGPSSSASCRAWLSSGGAERVAVPYGAVSAAKAALESHARQLALELGPLGIAVNCLRPGVTDTPALRAIPGHERWVEEALRRNPGGRMTTPEDVAAVLVALADPAVTWISGAVIPVDGGESVVG